MKQILKRQWAKALLILLLIVSVLLAAASAAGILFLENYGVYRNADRSSVRESIASSIAWHYKNTLINGYYESRLRNQDSSYYEDYFSRKNTNFFFRLCDEDGNLLLQNEMPEKLLWPKEEVTTYAREELVLETLAGDAFRRSAPRWNATQQRYEYIDSKSDKLYYYDPDGGVQDGNTGEWGSWSYNGNDTQLQMWRTVEHPLRIEYGVDASLSAPDDYKLQLGLLDLLLPLMYWLIVFLVGFALLAAACAWGLAWAAGRRPDSDQICLRRFDRLPFDVLLALEIAAIVGTLALLPEALYQIEYYHVVTLTGIALFLLGAVAGAGLIAVCMSLAVRVKTKNVLKNTLIFRLLRLLARITRKITLVWRTALVCFFVLLIQFFGLVVIADGAEGLIVPWIALELCLAGVVLWIALQFRRLRRSAEVLAAGNLSAHTDTARMLPEFARFGATLNQIGAAANAAADARMRSERMKTELITNVSHDLKTPLTSIINYVDLMGQLDELSPPAAREYQQVLQRQAARLKKLTEDLIEASKASSGAMPVQLAPVNLPELLQQATGEYAQRMEQQRLELIVQATEECMVYADGKLLWRVLDNLLGNCCKYAMPGTRVYLNVTSGESRAAIFVKNISQQKLEGDPSMLVERFVRADPSRSSEGSGLGLSIARSLTLLQGGTFSLATDADLFKVQMTLPLYLPEGRPA